MKYEIQTPRVYVAGLATYNNGVLHGAWIDADQSPGDIRAEIRAMLNSSPVPAAEEYAVHDYEHFEGVEILEYQSIETVAAYGAFIKEYGAIGGRLLGYYGDLDEAREAMEERFAGRYCSVEDFARELTEQAGDIPPHLAPYIDYDAMARDLEINDILVLSVGFEDLFIFWQR